MMILNLIHHSDISLSKLKIIFVVDKITIMTIREPSPSPAEAEQTSLSKAEQQSR